MGDHSYDHDYRHYFKKKESLKKWILLSHQYLTEQFSVQPVGFRSPAGVVTPPLKKAMADLSLPWIHWNKRFFDTNLPLSWTLPFCSFQSGDILLLHDRQRKFLGSGFLKSLRGLLGHLTDKGFDMAPIKEQEFRL